ncbi:MAG: pyruvate formate lyase family protein [Acidimicrobiales bacterium]|jgi:formate C-acetyltransferase
MTESGPSTRATRLKERLLASPFEADIERARYYTRAWKRTEGTPPAMRAALALEETLRNMSIRIDDDDQLVGTKTFKRLAGPIGIERWPIPTLLFDLIRHHGIGRRQDSEGAQGAGDGIGNSIVFDGDRPYLISDEECREMEEEILPYWEGKDLRSLKLDMLKQKGLYPEPPEGAGELSPEQAELVKKLPPGVVTVLKALRSFRDEHIDELPGTIDLQGHVTIGIKKVLDIGYRGIAEQAAATLADLDESSPNYPRRKDFLESVQVAADAVCEHAGRYAKLAREMAEQTEGQRKDELLAIARRCERVPALPPRDFVEALQSILMTQVTAVVSVGEDGILCPGRADQFVYPRYAKDLEAGTLTRQAAAEALEEYYLKLAYNIAFGPNNVTIGGVDKDGNDATNEVSYLFLETHEKLRGVRNGLAVRISPKTPREFLIAACRTHRRTAGVAFYNDDVVIRDLQLDGYSLPDARDYSVVGCTELTGTGNNNGYTASTSATLVIALEMALNEGRPLTDGARRLGVATPPVADLTTFEDLKKAFADQAAFVIDLGVRRAEVKDQAFAEAFPTPLLSSTIEGCVESGRDITQGGAIYNHSSVNLQGLATVANSLAAIRWAVFEEKLLTLEELVGHLRNNFEGAEDLRQRLGRKAPKYGNDNPEADDIATWVTDLLCRNVRQHEHALGGTYRASIISAGSQTREGRSRAASADGRPAGAAVSNGISPANGTELTGATAALCSVAKACASPVSNGSACNMNLNPATIKSDEGVEKLASLVEGYFRLGGRHVQFNPMGLDVLKDAQAHPEKYPDLMVKVSGYSTLFVDISKPLQDDIIARTEFADV